MARFSGSLRGGQGENMVGWLLFCLTNCLLHVFDTL